MSCERIETKRLILRRLRESDLNDFYHYSSKPENSLMMTWQPNSTREAALEVLRKLMTPANWAIEHREEEVMIGTVSLISSSRSNNPKLLELGYILSNEYWGEGLMQEAIRALLDRAFECDLAETIIAVIRVDNTRSLNTVAAMGFQDGGIIRDFIVDRTDGKPRSARVYSMRKQEWQDLRDTNNRRF
ncbi:MAG: GNAT family protein [Eubacteriales bacterium]|nr:GNAT family protein [Eubacteriales bacterium]